MTKLLRRAASTLGTNGILLIFVLISLFPVLSDVHHFAEDAGGTDP